MTKSNYAIAVDAIQAELRPFLIKYGYRVRGRTFNRLTEDELTQVINIQMGSADPPGTTYIPGLRENMHGLFTINLGIYVPEVAEKYSSGIAKTWIQEYHCCIRTRLGELVGAKGKEIWWQARSSADVVSDVLQSLKEYGLTFLDKFSTRDRILEEWNERSDNMGASNPPRIVLAIIHAERGHLDKALKLLLEQIQETKNPGHPQYVSELAKKLGIGDLNS